MGRNDNMKNLKFKTCQSIAKKYDEVFYDYITYHQEHACNMTEVSAYCRELKRINK